MSNVIDLSQLPFPGVVETLSFETIFAVRLAEFQALYPAYDVAVESDPVYKLIEENAYREIALRKRINEAAQAVMLAYATGADLDQLAALQAVTRLVDDPGDPGAIPPVDPTYETDARLRARVQLAPESRSVAGSSGAYEFHALSASTDVLDVDISSPAPGEVLVTVLSTDGNGTPDSLLLAAVDTILGSSNVRPLTDFVTVQAPIIVEYAIAATLYFYDGPDSAVVLAAATSAVTKYASDHHRLGHDITLSGLYAALHQAGVQRVVLAAPTADIAIANDEASWCTGITLTDGGIDE